MKGGEEGGGDGGIGRNGEGKREKEMRGEGERERGRGGDGETKGNGAERRAQSAGHLHIYEPRRGDMFVEQILNIYIFVSFKLVIT